MTYPKRLIEVDLPIKRISAHARREKSIRHGHISTLHIWWARRPLAACRAVICAALWPDPEDSLCPASFRETAERLMREWTTHERQSLLSAESRPHFETIRQNPANPVHSVQLRALLLDFIADFANWDNSTVPEYLRTARALTQAAHEALGGEPGTRPLVVDPFAGGGSIPLEALRVGADAFASDLNPVAVLLNKVVLEYIPKYGQRLADEVRKWGQWIKEEAEKELTEFYPKDPDGATPIAYLWARTIQCEGPGCGAEVPLIRSLWLAKKSNRAVALQIVPDNEGNKVDFDIIEKRNGKWVKQSAPASEIQEPEFGGTVKRGSATCPCCGYTTHVTSVRKQLSACRGGADSAKLMAVVMRCTDDRKGYRKATRHDIEALDRAAAALDTNDECDGNVSTVPDEPLPPAGALGFRVQKYGMTRWRDLFTARQLLALTTYTRLLQRLLRSPASIPMSPLVLCLGKTSQNLCSVTRWTSDAERTIGAFSMQTLQMVWDFSELNPLAAGIPSAYTDQIAAVCEVVGALHLPCGTVQRSDARDQILPSSAVDLIFTDPPYYDAISYADLSDFFYVWLRRAGLDQERSIFEDTLTPKRQQSIMNPSVKDELGETKDAANYEKSMRQAFQTAREECRDEGIASIVFAHKSTEGWESLLNAVVEAGWTVTASWPIDTEMGNRLRALGSAALASSVHLICRPRHSSQVAAWRDVLQELPNRIHDWMPRLSAEGVVGADAIFACLGPALEIFSRYSRVEKASGEVVTLKEYLEHVWAAVAKEALNLIFEGADATGFEEDERLTAMWLWTLKTGDANGGDTGEDDDAEEDSEGSAKKPKATGYALEYDAARKIAQGLGAHLETLGHLVEVKGDTATLLSPAARTRYLFGKEAVAASQRSRKKAPKQLSLDIGEALEEIVDEAGGLSADLSARPGSTVLDQVHQSMILFGAGRSEAVKRLLVEEGVGRNSLFWRLAQSLSALYPANSEEKRWVDGVLARKKGLGL